VTGASSSMESGKNLIMQDQESAVDGDAAKYCAWRVSAAQAVTDCARALSDGSTWSLAA
jgi:hypothetical protein